jgi:hypothetical protein
MSQMWDAKGMLETWLNRPRQGRHDFHALIVVSFTVMGHRALGAGSVGVRFAWWVLAAILVVLLIATLDRGGWFRRRKEQRRGARTGLVSRRCR